MEGDKKIRVKFGSHTNALVWIIWLGKFSSVTLPDTQLQRRLLSVSGNPSRVFMCLELGVIPVKFVIMAKRTNMLHYILKEESGSTMRQVYEELKIESRKGDFYSLVKKDLEDLNIPFDESMILKYSKPSGKTT